MKSRTSKDKLGSETLALIRRFTTGFANGTLSRENAALIVKLLRQHVDTALPLLEEQLSAADESARTAIIALLRAIGDERAIGPLRRLLLSPECSDDNKMGIMYTLSELGEPVDDATYRRLIPDPEALIMRSMEKLLEAMDDPPHAEMFLSTMEEEMHPEAQTHYVRQVLVPSGDRRLLPFLSALMYSEHDDVVLAAVEAIENLKEPAGIPLLEERARFDPSRRVRRSAENAALRLQTRFGDQPPRPGGTPPPPLVYCLISTIDGNGGQVLFVAWEQPGDEMLVLDLLFNDHQGVKDCFSTVLDEDELDDVLEHFGEGIEFVPVTLPRAREAVAEAHRIALEAERRLPMPFALWRPWLEEEDPRSVEETVLPALDPARQQELLERCEELLSLEEFVSWFFNPDEVDFFVSRYEELLSAGQAIHDSGPLRELVDEALEALLDEDYQRLLAARLRRQAWLLAQLYEEEEVPLWALAAAEAIERGETVRVPLLRGMMLDSFLNAVQADWYDEDET
jgi:hypothetical protein